MGFSHGYLTIFFVALGSFTYGFNNSVIGSVLGLQSFYDYFDLQVSGGSRTDSIIGATSGLFAGGGAIGALFLAPLANRYGRIRAIQVTCIVCIIAGIIQGASVHVAMFLVGRFVSGLGVGLMVTLVPIYQSEISPAEMRGRMVGSHGFLIVSGYAVAAWVGYACYFSPNPAFQWRFELSVQVLAPLILLLGSVKLPESPRWLVEKDRFDQALDVLGKLHGDGPDGHAKVQEEYNQIRDQLVIDKEMEASTGRWALIRESSYRKRLICGCFVQFVGQSTGVLVINNYQVLLYNSLGLYNSVPLLLYAVYLTWAAGMNYVSSLIMDRTGRVNLMVFGLLGCAVAVICETAMVAEFSGTTNKVGNGFGVFFLFLFVTFYGSCLDATTYVYSAEVFPTHIRGLGMGISIFTQFCATLVYTQVAPTAFSNIGWRFYLVFIIIPVLGAVFIYFTFPETKGLSLEEITNVFQKDKHIKTHSEFAASDVESKDYSKEGDVVHQESV